MVTVLLVRHADIDVPAASTDPSLNAAGRARAKTLAHVVGAAGVTTVYTSTFARTKETVKPFVVQSGLQSKIAPAAALLAQQVTSGSAGAVVLIAGHSDTIPQFIAALGVPLPAPVIGPTQFDNLFVVTVRGPGAASLARLKYGKPSA